MKNELIQDAIQFANLLRRRTNDLKQAVSAAQVRLVEARGHLKANETALARFEDFQPIIGGIPQCPKCWMLHEKASNLWPFGSATKADIFRCRACDHELIIDNA